jgi:hypothetical protein
VSRPVTRNSGLQVSFGAFATGSPDSDEVAEAADEIRARPRNEDADFFIEATSAGTAGIA